MKITKISCLTADTNFTALRAKNTCPTLYSTIDFADLTKKNYILLLSFTSLGSREYNAVPAVTFAEEWCRFFSFDGQKSIENRII
jgi:hypothetical protein